MTSVMNPGTTFIDVDGDTFVRMAPPPPPPSPSFEALIPSSSVLDAEAARFMRAVFDQPAPRPPLDDLMMADGDDDWDIVSDGGGTGDTSGIGSARDIVASGSARDVAASGADRGATDIGAADAGRRPKRPKLTMRERAANGATKIGQWARKKVICPHQPEGVVDLWVPARGPWKSDCEKVMSDAVSKFRKGRHHPVFFYRFLGSLILRMYWGWGRCCAWLPEFTCRLWSRVCRTTTCLFNQSFTHVAIN